MDFRNRGTLTIFLLHLMVVKIHSECNATISHIEEISSALNQKSTDAVYIRKATPDILSFNLNNDDDFCATWVITRTLKGELTLSFSPAFKPLSFGMLSFGIKDIAIKIDTTSCSDDELLSKISMYLHTQFIEVDNQTAMNKMCFAKCHFDFVTRAVSNNYKCCDLLDGSLQCTEHPQSATLTVMNVLVFLLLLKLLYSSFYSRITNVNFYEEISEAERRFIVHPKHTEQFTITYLTKNMLLAEKHTHNLLSNILTKKVCSVISCFQLSKRLKRVLSRTLFFSFLVIGCSYLVQNYIYTSFVAIPLAMHIGVLFIVSIVNVVMSNDMIQEMIPNFKSEQPFLQRILEQSLCFCKCNPIIGVLCFPVYYPIFCVWFLLLFIYYESEMLQLFWIFIKDVCFIIYSSKKCNTEVHDNAGTVNSNANDNTYSWEIIDPNNHGIVIFGKIWLVFFIFAIALASFSLHTVWTIYIIVNILSYFLLGLFLNIQYVLKYIYIPVIIILYLYSKFSSILKEYACFYSDVLNYLPRDQDKQGDLEQYVYKREEDNCKSLSAKFFSEVCTMKFHGSPGPLLDKLAEIVVGAVLISMLSVVIYMMLDILSINMTESDDISYWINLGALTFTVALWLLQRVYGISSNDDCLSEDIAPDFKESLERELQSFIDKERKKAEGEHV